MSEINCEEIRESMRNGAQLLDVRTSEEYKSGALPDAVNMPLHILPVIADERMKPDAPIFVYCQSGGRSMMAEKILRNMGYENVKNLGGIAQIARCH